MIFVTLYHKIPKRFILCFFVFWAQALVNVQKSDLSIAIVAMVPETGKNISLNQTSSEPTSFAWSNIVQGVALASFFIGYLLAQVPAGFGSLQFGGKNLMGIGLGICGFFGLIIPATTDVGVALMIVARIIQGIGGGMVLPSTYTVWTNWAPKEERSIMGAVTFSGTYAGVFFSMLFGGLIIEYWSWKWLFYISGVITLIFTAWWFYMVTESPAEHPNVSKEELNLIQSSVQPPIVDIFSTPWVDILISLPVWAVISAHTGANWNFYFFIIELPSFLHDSLHFKIDQSGILSAIPWILVILVIIISGIVADELRKKRSTKSIRKIMYTIALSGTIFFLFLTVIVRAKERVVLVVLIYLTMSICAISVSVYGSNHLDISGRYAGIVMGLSNTAATVPGILIPIITGAVVNSDESKGQWNIMFLLSICVSICALGVYITFASGETETWANTEPSESETILKKPLTPIQTSLPVQNQMEDLSESLRAEVDVQN